MLEPFTLMEFRDLVTDNQGKLPLYFGSFYDFNVCFVFHEQDYVLVFIKST